MRKWKSKRFRILPETYSPASLYELFDERRRELGLKQEDVGMMITGRPDSSVFQNMRRGAVPSIHRVSDLCKVLELECYIGPPRRKSAAGRAQTPTEGKQGDPTS